MNVGDLIADGHTDMIGVIINVKDDAGVPTAVEILWEGGYISSRWGDDVRPINESR